MTLGECGEILLGGDLFVVRCGRCEVDDDEDESGGETSESVINVCLVSGLAYPASRAGELRIPPF